MKRGKKMFIIILSTLGALCIITWGAIAYLGRSQTLSIKSSAEIGRASCRERV